MTTETYAKLAIYMRRYPAGGNFDFYCSLPVLSVDAKEDVRVLKNGQRYPICL